MVLHIRCPFCGNATFAPDDASFAYCVACGRGNVLNAQEGALPPSLGTDIFKVAFHYKPYNKYYDDVVDITVDGERLKSILGSPVVMYLGRGNHKVRADTAYNAGAIRTKVSGSTEIFVDRDREILVQTRGDFFHKVEFYDRRYRS